MSIRKPALNSATNQPSKFRTKYFIEVKDDVHGIWSEGQVCDCSDAYILLRGTIKITGEGVNAAARRVHKKINKKNCVIYWLHKRKK